MSLEALENPLQDDKDLESGSDFDDDSETGDYNDTGSLVTNPFERTSESGQSGVRLPMNNSATISTVGSYKTVTGRRKGTASRASMASRSTDFDPDAGSNFRSMYALNAHNPYVGEYRAAPPKKASIIKLLKAARLM